jgi:hypothetical protein
MGEERQPADPVRRTISLQSVRLQPWRAALYSRKFNTNKSKVFFYWGEEWLKYNFQESGSSLGSAGLLLVPSVKMRQGDFSELLDPNNAFVTRKDASGNKVPVYIKDPQSPNPCTTADQSGCFPAISFRRIGSAPTESVSLTPGPFQPH